jgi:carboxymethylenebutenolidase
MQTSTIEITTSDGPMALYEAVPDGDVRGGMVVIQEAFGVNSYIEDVTNRFADLGYHAVAPHLFHRAGGGTVPYGDFGAVIAKYEGLTDDAILVDADAALAHLAAAGRAAAATGIVGFCFGGRVTFLVAARRRLGAAIGFYGGGIVTQRFPQFPSLVSECATLKTPWLGLFGGLDQSIPVEDVDRLRVELDAAPVDTDVVLYPDADHGFFRDVGEAYHPEAAADGWKRTQAWLDEHLAP